MPGQLPISATLSWHRTAIDAATLAVGALAAWRMVALNGLPNWAAFSVVLLLACAGSRMRLQMPRLQGSLSLWFPFGFVAILDQPAWAAFVLLSAAGTFDRLTPGRALRTPGRETALESMIFVASTAVATLAATSAASLTSGEEGHFWAARATLAASVYFVVWSVPAALRRAVHTQTPLWTIWSRQYFWAGPIYLLAPCGALVARLLVDGRNSFDTFLGLSIIAGAYWYLQAYFPRLHERQDHIEKLARVREKALETLAVAIEAKDGSTAGHLERVKLLAGRLARELGCSDNEQRTLSLAAVLHDVGKIGVPDSILSKPGRLTEAEFRAISTHADIGADIVASMEFPDPVDEVVRCHHEHWDGSGYPAGLKGERIPRLARILTVVDCFDALVSQRPYRQPLTIEQAAELMRQQRGKILDPEVLDVFLEQLQGYSEEIREKLLEDLREAKRRDRVRGSLRQTWIDSNKELEALTQGNPISTLSRRPDLLEAYHRAMTLLGADLDFDRAFGAVLELVCQATRARVAGLFEHDEELEVFVLRCGRGLGASEDGEVGIPANRGLAAEAVRRRVPLSSTSADGATGGVDGVAARLAAPLFAGDQLVGLLLLGADEPGAFGAQESALLELVGEKLALTLLACDDLRRIQTDALTDPVTSLPNAAASLHRLEQEVQRAERERQPLGVLFMDINGLKLVNDSFGHSAGDRLLQGTSRRLRDALRSYDFVGRLGGDEFLALLPGISPEALRETTHKLKAVLQKNPVQLGENEQAYAMVSVGEANFPSDAKTARGLLAVSDERMYRDKATAAQTPPTPDHPKTMSARTRQ